MRIQLDSKNECIKLAELISWAELERRSYVETFGSEVGNVGKPARITLDVMIIKERYGFSDEDTLQEIRMNL